MSSGKMSLNEEAEQRVRDLSAANDGEITPDEVFEDARNKESPLHDLFEWDETEAARKYNLQIARNVIASVTIEVTITKSVITVPEFVRNPDKPGNEQGYVDIASVVANNEEEIARKIIHAELGRMQAAIHRAIGYSTYFKKEMKDKLEGMKDDITVMQETLKDAA